MKIPICFKTIFSRELPHSLSLSKFCHTSSFSVINCSIETRYYRWPNGTFSLVPNSDFTVNYYLVGKDGYRDSQQRGYPKWEPFPKGLRMIAGDPFRRTFNSSIVEHQAIKFFW